MAYSEMVPEIHKTEKCDFLKPITLSQIIQISVFSDLLGRP